MGHLEATREQPARSRLFFLWLGDARTAKTPVLFTRDSRLAIYRQVRNQLQEKILDLFPRESDE